MQGFGTHVREGRHPGTLQMPEMLVLRQGLFGTCVRACAKEPAG